MALSKEGFFIFLSQRHVLYTYVGCNPFGQMSKGYSIKADNKPTLFTWDLETEYQNVDRELKSERTKDTNRLETKRLQLRQLKSDFHDIVFKNEINVDQVDRFFNLIRQGQSGVWEASTLAIERLAYHFEPVKTRLLTELVDSDSKYVANLVTSIGEFFDKDELKKLFTNLLKHKNTKVKERTLNKIFELRFSGIKDDLERLKEIETNKGTIDQIEFTLKYVDTPKGNLTISR